MLGLSDAHTICNYVNRELFNGEKGFTIEDAMTMTVIPGSYSGDSLTVLGISKDDTTILVWVQFRGTGLLIKNGRKVCW